MTIITATLGRATNKGLEVNENLLGAEIRVICLIMKSKSVLVVADRQVET